MSALRGSRFVLASLAIHVVGGIAVLAVRHPPDKRRPGPVSVEIRRPKAPPPPVPVAPVEPARQPERTPPPRPPSKQTPPPATPPRPVAPPPVAPPPVAPPPVTPPPANPPPSNPPPRKLDLFNTRALETAVGGTGIIVPVVPGKQGTTKSAARGDRDPNQRDANFDREEAASRIGEFAAEASSAERLRTSVPPRFREAERLAQNSFHPAPAVVSDENVAKSFFSDWMNSTPTGGVAPRGVDESRSGFNSMGGQGAGARIERGEGARTKTIVEVVLAADGSITSARVVSPSGRRKYDQEALELVKKAIAGGGPLEEKVSVVTKWSVEAWVHVTPPAPALGFTFDETGTTKARGDYPGKKKVETSVKLISYAKR